MSEETVRKMLKDVGLTEKETEVYLFLAKHGALKGTEISKQTKKHKAQIYNILKHLQDKGLAESTLEFPTRFIAVPIEKVIDLNVKTKREQATSIENTKKEIMAYWKNVGQTKLEESLEKFVVIEGSTKIYGKFGQMMNETKSQFSAYLTVPDLLSAYKFGLFESPDSQSSVSKPQFRALVEFAEQELPTLKNFLGKRLIKNFDLKGKNPSLGLGISPRMAVRDEEELMLFVTKRNSMKSETNDVCLWTNCRTLVFSFLSVFRDLWRSALALKRKLLR